MRGYLRRFSPRGGVDDFLTHWRQPTPYRWQILALSVALTFTVMVLFVPENQAKAPERPHVTYITTFEPGRTDAEIAASNQANQARQDRIEAELAAAEERKKQMYRDLGRATGVDVDAMERRLAEQRAAEKPGAQATGER